MNTTELMRLMRTALDECKTISEWDRDGEWYAAEGINWREACMLKDRTVALYDQRWRAVCEVIDLIAEEFGLHDKGLYLYGLGYDDTHPIIDCVRDYVSKAGDKAVMKKRLAELENENAVLRSLVGRVEK